MLEITNPTTPLSVESNEGRGLFIQGFEEQENRLNGTDDDDVITGGNRDDLLFGLGGSDIIDGDLGGADLLDGGAGNDIISGFGADTLIGGAGNDSFIFNVPTMAVSEIPVIEDFTVGEDTLGLIGLDRAQNVDYNRDTGVISVNGKAVVKLGRELSISDRDLDFDSLDFDNDDLATAGQDFNFSDGTSGVEDVFSFSRDAIDSGRIIPINGFVPGEDTIQLEGMSSGDNIDYNRSNGVLSINGESFAQIDRELPLDKNRDFSFS